MSAASFNAVVVILLGLLASLWLFRASKRVRLPYPPGPPPAHIIGNLRQMPKEHIWLWFSKLNEKYGDIVHLRALNQHIIVLNSLRATQALLVQKSSKYCSRPRIPMAELIGWDSTGMMGIAGPRWRTTRKVLHQYLTKAAVLKYHPMLESKVRGYTREILRNPDQLFSETRLLAIRLIISLSYGLEIEGVDDQLVTLSENAGDTFSKAAQQGRFLVNSFPLLRHVPAWFPLADFQRQARVWRQEITNSVAVPYIRAKKAIETSSTTPSLISHILEDGNGIMSEDHLMWFTGGLYSAAVDTTAQTILNFVLAMVLHPEIQKRGKDEIDSIIGPDRLPTINDREQLPYIEKIVKETMRWQPVVPTSLPYWLIEDDVNDGYYLPQWSIVIANSWAISRDEAMFPNPEEFRPDRWEDGTLADPTRFAFGYGRRVCGGINFAEAAVWYTIATLLATVKFTKARDFGGHEILPKIDHVGDGLVRLVKKFDYNIEARSPNSSVLLAEDAGNA